MYVNSSFALISEISRWQAFSWLVSTNTFLLVVWLDSLDSFTYICHSCLHSVWTFLERTTKRHAVGSFFFFFLTKPNPTSRGTGTLEWHATIKCSGLHFYHVTLFGYNLIEWVNMGTKLTWETNMGSTWPDGMHGMASQTCHLQKYPARPCQVVYEMAWACHPKL